MSNNPTHPLWVPVHGTPRQYIGALVAWAARHIKLLNVDVASFLTTSMTEDRMMEAIHAELAAHGLAVTAKYPHDLPWNEAEALLAWATNVATIHRPLWIDQIRAEKLAGKENA